MGDRLCVTDWLSAADADAPTSKLDRTCWRVRRGHSAAPDWLTARYVQMHNFRRSLFHAEQDHNLPLGRTLQY